MAVISDTEEEDKEEEEELEVEEVEMEEPTTNTQKSPVVIVIDDDDDDDDGNNKKWEIPELKEGDSHNYSQIYSYKREVHESVASQQNSPDNVPLGNDPEANLEIIDQELPTTDKLISVTEQPRKRKTSKTCVAPGKPVIASMPVLPNVPSLQVCLPHLFCSLCWGLKACPSCLPVLSYYSNFLVAKGNSHPN